MLKRKMVRDIWQNKIQFVSIFLMVFLGSFIYSGVGGEYTGIQTTSEEYYEEQNAADIWIYTTNFKEDISILKQINGVEEVERRLILDVTINMEHNPKLNINYIDTYDISKFYTVEGENFDPEAKGVYLDSMFASANHLSLGDKLTYKAQGKEVSYPIIGLIMSPDYVYYSKDGDMIPNHENYGFAYLSNKVLPEEIRQNYSQILVKASSPEYEEIVKQIETKFDDRYSAMITREDQSGHEALREEINQHAAMGSIFPIAFLAIAVLSVLTTMIRLISNQRSIISTLKALGFRNRKILFHYLSYGFVISLIAAVLGSLLGPISLPYLFYPAMSTTYILPSWEPRFSANFLLLPSLLVFSCTLITYFVCRSFLKETPAEGMKMQSIKMMKKSRIEKVHVWRRLGFSNKWNFRDILRNKARSFMVVIGIAGCTGLLLCAFGIMDSINDFVEWQFRDINHYKTQLKLDPNVQMEEVDRIMKSVRGERLMEASIEVKAKDQRKSAVISVVEDKYQLIDLRKENRDLLKVGEGEIALTSKLAEILNVSVGDTINWRMYGEEQWIEKKVTMLYYAPTIQGITMTQSTLEKSGEMFRPTQIITNEVDVKKQNGIASIWNQQELKTSMLERLEMAYLLVSILVFAAILMAFIVLYCLGIISFTEKYRDFATLKVLGLKTRKIRWLLIQQNLYLTIIGIPFGFLFGQFLLRSIMVNMSEAFDILMYISINTYLLCMVITLVVSLLISLLFSRRAKTIDMVSALKGSE